MFLLKKDEESFNNITIITQNMSYNIQQCDNLTSYPHHRFSHPKKPLHSINTVINMPDPLVLFICPKASGIQCTWKSLWRVTRDTMSFLMSPEGLRAHATAKQGHYTSTL